MTEKTHFTLPDDTAVVAVRVPAYAALQGDDRRRAVALALTRDLGVRTEAIEFAFEPLGAVRAEDVMVAYRSRRNAAYAPASPIAVDLSWVSKVASGVAFWVFESTDSSNRRTWLLSDQGAIVVPVADISEEAPSALFALAAARARMKTPLHVLIAESETRPNAALTDARLARWSASLGVAFENSSLVFNGPRWTLTPPPAPQAIRRATAFDRALNFALVASVLCATLALVRYAMVPQPQRVASVSVAAGELLLRTTSAAPELLEHIREATFAGGAWVISAPTLPPERLLRIEAMLAANAIAAQTVREPEIRIRVQAP
jgi:hypothetical protein